MRVATREGRWLAGSVLLLAGVLSSAPVLAGTWSDTARMFQDRHRHTATLLPSGQVLVAGGNGEDGVRSSAELYDPVTGSWTVTGALAEARQNHTATLMRNGQVLVVGGRGDCPPIASCPLSSAELYAPSTGVWSATGALTDARAEHTATLLPSGKVLVVGGNKDPTILDSAELYDPATGAWTDVGPAKVRRWKHTATLLLSGKVLVVGGANVSGDLDSVELYDPAAAPASAWSDAQPLTTPRDRHTATLLPNGHVLVVGGGGAGKGEIYDPEPSPDPGLPGTWSDTDDTMVNRDLHTATLLPSGEVLVAGGVGLDRVDLFDPDPVPDPPEIGAWRSAAVLGRKRETHTATLLPSGQVLVVGGFGANASLSAVEIYDPDVGKLAAPDPLTPAREGHAATLLRSGEVLVTGGRGSAGTDLGDADLFAGGAWSEGNPLTARSGHTATLLPSGRVLVTGGIGGASRLSSVQLYNLDGTWSTLSVLTGARSDHTATLLPSGRVLITGGFRDNISPEVSDPPISSVEIYVDEDGDGDDDGAWTSSDTADCGPGDIPDPANPCPLSNIRGDHTATLLPSGKVLVVGGRHLGGNRTSVDLYDPATGAWAYSRDTNLNLCVSGAPPHPAAPCPLSESRGRHTATLLPSGRVLVAGGSGPSGELKTAEIYDPIIGVWTFTGSLAEGRSDHTATLLPSGRVLVTGGCSNRVFGDCVGERSSAEVYAPAAGTWTPVENLAEPRKGHTATLLPSGEVLIVGGGNNCTRLGAVENCVQLSSVERYDPGPVDSVRRPVLTEVAGQLVGPAVPIIEYGESFAVKGKQLGGDSAASGGNTRSSEVHHPFVQLRAVDGPEQAWLRIATGFCSTTGQPCSADSDCPATETCEPPAAPAAFCSGTPRPLGFCSDQEATLTVTGLPPIFQPGLHLLRAVTVGVASAPQLVELKCSLVILRPPQDQSEPIGATATFEVVAAGGRAFQWQQCDGDPANACAAGGSLWADIPGATAPRYTTPAIVGQESARRFRVKVDSGCRQTTTNAATLTVDDAQPPVVQVISPSGGEFWLLSDPDINVPANTEPITWSMSDDVRVCRVRVSLLSSSNGVDFTELQPAAPGLPANFPAAPQPTLPCFFPGENTSSALYAVPRNLDLLGGGGRQYKIRVTVTDHAGNLQSADSANPFFIVRPNNDSVKTLILWHSCRLGDKSCPTPNTFTTDLAPTLKILADHPLVQGRLVDLATVGSVGPLFQAWDGDRGSVALANAVLFADGGIQAHLLDQLLPVFTGVESLVLVGGDEVIPLARLEDRAEVLSEEDYPDGFDLTPSGSTVGMALAANHYLSDDPLAVLDRVTLDAGGSVSVGANVCSNAAEDLAWIPDLAVGRLVETPTEITRTITTFVSQGGILDLSARFCSLTATQACVANTDCPLGESCAPAPGQVLVTGYDFLLDSAADIAERWEGRLTAPAVGADLVDPAQGWGTAALRAGLCGDGGAPYPIASLNGHANHYGEGVPGTDPFGDQGLSTGDLAAADACGVSPNTALDLSGAVFYAVGCHGGLSVPDSAPTADHPFDLPQTMMGLGAVAYVANTGYGWGLREGPPGYGERMVVLMTEQLTAGGTVKVGAALKATKRRYLAEDSGCFDAYDQKSVMQWTLFGLPMYSVQLAQPAAGSMSVSAGERPARELAQWPEVEHLRGVTVSRREPLDQATLPSFLTRLDLHFDFSAAGVYRKFAAQADGATEASTNLELTDLAAPCPADSTGCFYTLNGLASGQADLPVQPYFVFDSRLSGTSQHGVLWTGGEYQQESGWKPLRATLQSNNEPMNPDEGNFENLGALPHPARGKPRPTRQLPGKDPDTAQGCRPSDLELNKLVIPTGETVETVGDAPGKPSVERRDHSVNLEIFYFNDTVDALRNCDRDGPAFGAGPHHLDPAGTVVSWAVQPTDPSGVWRVLVVIDDESQNAWVPLELEDDDGDGIWTGSYDTGGPTELTYFLQAVDLRGNVSWLEFVPEPAGMPTSGIPSGLPAPTAVQVASAQADLAITKDDGQTAAIPGQPVTYWITVTNHGPATVTAMTVIDTLPASILSPVFTPNAGSYASASGAWSGLSLVAGGSVTLTLVGTVDPAASGQLLNRVSVATPAGVIDPVAANNQAEDLDDLGPAVLRVHSVASTGGGALSPDEHTLATLTQLTVTFSEPVSGAAVANNYLLVEAGANGVPESGSCAVGRVGDDAEVAINGVVYYPLTRTAALAVGVGRGLPQGLYRLLVCGTIANTQGSPLVGGDFARDFRVVVAHLLRNPTFDVSLANWLQVAESPGDILHIPFDVDEAASSGSARVSRLVSEAPIYALAQCVSSSAESGLRFGGSVLLDSPSPSGPLAFAQVELFGSPNCTGQPIASTRTGVVNAAPGAVWQALPAAAAILPAGALSALVSFVVDPAGAVAFDAYFDDLFAYLSADLLIFSDGFESGDTSRWSATSN